MPKVLLWIVRCATKFILAHRRISKKSISQWMLNCDQFLLTKVCHISLWLRFEPKRCRLYFHKITPITRPYVKNGVRNLG